MKAKKKQSTVAVRERVFLAYREFFAEKNTLEHTGRTIRNLVRQNWSAKKNLVGGCALEKVVHVLKALHDEGAFKSEAQAGNDFLNVFPKPSQNDCRLERGGAISAVVGASGNLNASLGRPIKIEFEGRKEDLERQGQSIYSSTLYHPPKQRSYRLIRVEDPRTNLEPHRFPYDIQHQILSRTQQLLEESCFNFVGLWLPSVLEKLGWNCAAAGELTEWLNILREHALDLPERCISTEGRALLNNVAPAVARLRHTAVHRLHLTPEAFLEQIHSACKLAEVLQDARSMSTLQALYRLVDTHAKKMECGVVAIQEEVGAKLDQINKQKEALVQQEHQLLSDAAQRNINIPIAIGQALLDSIAMVLIPDKPIVIMEKRSIGGRDKSDAQAYDVIFEDDDIESDEDRLQAELR
jgi:hypothetical protein